MKLFKFDDFIGMFGGVLSGNISVNTTPTKIQKGTLPNHTSLIYYLDGKDIVNTGSKILKFEKYSAISFQNMFRYSQRRTKLCYWKSLS